MPVADIARGAVTAMNTHLGQESPGEGAPGGSFQAGEAAFPRFRSIRKLWLDALLQALSSGSVKAHQELLSRLRQRQGGEGGLSPRALTSGSSASACSSGFEQWELGDRTAGQLDALDAANSILRTK